MKISIIIPIYNQEEYIVDTIISVKNQTFKNFECILINDGSTDDSQKIVEREIIDDSRFKLYSRENQGVSATRNYGVEISSGDYIYFIDGDDTIPIDAMQKLYTAALEKDADIVIGKMVHKINGQDKEISTYLLDGVYKGGYKTLEENPEILHSIGPTAKLFKRNLIRDLLFPINLKFAEEHEFIVAAYVKSKVIYTIEDVSYYYHIREQNNSATQTINNNVKEYMMNLIESHIKVHSILEQNKLHKALKFYGYRITNYIMFPLLLQAAQNNQLIEITKIIDDYLNTSAVKTGVDKNRIKEIYLYQVINNLDYTGFIKQKPYFQMVHKHINTHNINKMFPDRVDFYSTKMCIRIKIITKKIYRKIKINI